MYAGRLCPDITTRKGALSDDFHRICAALDGRRELWSRLISTAYGQLEFNFRESQAHCGLDRSPPNPMA